MARILETISKLPKSRKILIGVGLFAVILALYFYFFYMPNSKILKEKTTEMVRLETDVRQLRAIAADIKRYQAENLKLREELNLAMAQLPTSKEIPSLLANVSNLGKESGLEFLLFRPMPEVSREFYADIPVEIKVKGTYKDVAVFFDRVGKLPRIVNISGVTIEGAKEVAGRWEVTTSCTATTFKFIEKESANLEKDKNAANKGVSQVGK